MAIERIRPIVDAAGDPFYVVGRDYIGAEHANAQAAWTRETHPVLTRQHTVEGVHDWLPIPRAAILGVSSSGGVLIDPRSRVMGYRQTTDPADPDPDAYVDLVTAQLLGVGYVRFTLNIPLPPAIDYGLINLTPGAYIRGTMPGSGRLEPMHLQLIRISTGQFDLQMTARSGAAQNGAFSFLLVS